MSHISKSVQSNLFILQFSDDVMCQTVPELFEGVLKRPLLMLHTLAQGQQSGGNGW